MLRLLKTALLGGCLALLAAGAAIAQGSSIMSGRVGTSVGGGMGSMSPQTGTPAEPRYDPAVEYAKAIAAIRASQFKEAERAATHVTQVAPANPDGWRLLGAAYAGDSRWTNSRRAYAKAVKLAPNDANGHAGLGLAMANLQDPKAQEQLDWLKAKAKACGDGCPDADHLKRFSETVEGAMTAPAAAASDGRS
jgi:predicted Zn-dependent protease